MKSIFLLLFMLFCKIVIAQQNKNLIFENDSIAIYDTYLSLNSKENIAPIIYKDGLIYASANASGFYKVYFSDLKSNPQKIKIKGNRHVGLSAIYNNEAYITKTVTNFKKGFLNVDGLAIFKGTIENLKVSKLKPLTICKEGSNYGHPSITKNGNKMVIVTNEKGAFHLLELVRDTNNEWQRSEIIFITHPRFTIINPTYYDENTIYFSSNEYDGKIEKVEYSIENDKPVINNVIYERGDYNIYKTVKIDGKWSLPRKVSVLNSEFDDLSVVFITEKTGYINSFRYDDTDNIYYFELKQ
ncbi:hypothetical protein [Lutibacter sp.]|uniref:hypothetical protein n=1 Tax=Lutibacter sp. TaxID=1925666 RepID=UPI003565DA8B